MAIHHLIKHFFSTSFFLYKSSISVPLCISIAIYLYFLLMSYTYTSLSICITIYFYAYISFNYLLISIFLEQFGTRIHISYLSAIYVCLSLSVSLSIYPSTSLSHRQSNHRSLSFWQSGTCLLICFGRGANSEIPSLVFALEITGGSNDAWRLIYGGD